MEELSDLIFLSQEEAEAAVAVEEVEVALVEAVEETEVAEAEASAEEEAEASEEAEVEASVEAEVEAEVEVSVAHQEEDSNMTPLAHLTAKCYEHFERHRVAESKYNNNNPSFIFGCLLLPRGWS